MPLIRIPEVPYLPAGMAVFAGTNYPRSRGRSTAALVVEFDGRPTRTEARRIFVQAWAALEQQMEMTQAQEAAWRFRAADKPTTLPRFRPPRHTVGVCWLRVPSSSEPILGFFSRYEDKEDLCTIWEKALRGMGEEEGQALPSHYARRLNPRDIWHKWLDDLKLWGIRAPDYPALLGEMRRQSFRLKWLHREGFPPPPPIEEIP